MFVSRLLRRRLPGAAAGRRRACRGLVAAGDRRGQSGLLLVAFINGGDAVRRPGAARDQPLGAPAALFPPRPTRRSRSPTSARPTWPSPHGGRRRRRRARRLLLPGPVGAGVDPAGADRRRRRRDWHRRARRWPPPGTGSGTSPGARPATSTPAGCRAPRPAPTSTRPIRHRSAAGRGVGRRAGDLLRRRLVLRGGGLPGVARQRPATQSRVLMNRLQAAQYDGIARGRRPRTGGAEGADQPAGGGHRVRRAGSSPPRPTRPTALRHAAGRPTRRRGQTERVNSQLNSSRRPTPSRPWPDRLDDHRLAAEPGQRRARRRSALRYASDGSDLDPEQVVSSPALGPTDADQGLAAAGDVAGDAAAAWVQGSGASTVHRRRAAVPGPGRVRALQQLPLRRQRQPDAARGRRLGRAVGLAARTPCASTASRSARPPPPRWSRRRRWPTAATPSR